MQRDDNAAFNLFRLNLWARHFLHPHQHPDGRAPMVPHLPSPYAPPVPAPSPIASNISDGHLSRPVFPGLHTNPATATSIAPSVDELINRRASLQFHHVTNGHSLLPDASMATSVNSSHRISASSPEVVTSPESEESSDTEPC